MILTQKESVLKQLLTEINICDSLREHWSYLKHWNNELVDCQLIRIFPKSIEKFVLLYELELKSADKSFKQQIFAEWMGENAQNHFDSLLIKLQKSKRAQLTKERLENDPICCLPDLGLVIRMQGLDEKIDGLGLIQQPSVLVAVLENQLEFNKGSINKLETEILGHRLGKRCIAQVNFQYIHSHHKENNSLFVKWYKTESSTGHQVHQLTERLYQNQFSRDYRIRIPKPLGFDEQYNLLIMEHAEGRILTEMPASAHEGVLFRAGQAINKLHQIKPAGLNIFSVEDEINIINYWVPLTASVFPELSASLFKALDLIRAQLATMPSVELTLVHRDFYEKQILFTDNSTILIDFDTACLSDPAIDLGNFIAHLQLLDLQGISLPIDAVNCFVNGYGAEYTDGFHHRVMLFKRSTLLRLACLYSFWPQYNQLPKQLLQLFYDNE